MERLHNWAIAMAGVMVASFLTALVAQGWRAWTALAIGLVALIALAMLVSSLWLREPRLFIDSPDVEPVTIPGWLGDQKYVYLKARNDPRLGMEAIEHIFVTLRFTREKTGEIVYDEVLARWSHLPQLKSEDLAAMHIARPVRIPGDKSIYRIEVAIHPDQDQMYVINDESPLRGYKLRPLGCDPLLVDVRARCATSGRHIDKTFRFRLSPGLTMEPL